MNKQILLDYLKEEMERAEKNLIAWDGNRFQEGYYEGILESLTKIHLGVLANDFQEDEIVKPL